jgi:hypothetical protein
MADSPSATTRMSFNSPERVAGATPLSPPPLAPRFVRRNVPMNPNALRLLRAHSQRVFELLTAHNGAGAAGVAVAPAATAPPDVPSIAREPAGTAGERREAR